MVTSTLETTDLSGRAESRSAVADRGCVDCDAIYRRADGALELVPWANEGPHPAFLAWLNAEAPCLVRPGCRVAVVGCGLGDDAIELINRGFDVTAFDHAASAIAWAKERFPRHAHTFVEADVFEAPSKWRHRFDLVIDVNNIPWVDREKRPEYAARVVDLLHPNGALFVICTGCDSPDRMEHHDDPLPPAGLLSLFASKGLAPTRALDDFTDDATPPQRWLRGVFRGNR